MGFLFMSLQIKLAFLLVHYLLFADCVSSSVPQPSCHDDEKSALLQFKVSFLIRKSASAYDGAYPKVLSWKPENSTNCCSWDGIQCDEETGHVIGLHLGSSCLFGSINSNNSLFRLVHLNSLDLSDNDFNYSQIPASINRFSGLTYLDLSNSNFFGQVPIEVSDLYKLTYLDLSANYHEDAEEKLLELKSPDMINLLQNLTSLEMLNLSYIDISSTVPDFLSNFSSLKSLLLKDCELDGDFPAQILQLPNLQILNVRYNRNLIGYVPEFNQRSPLTKLRLGFTSFSGTLPSSIENLDSLNILDVKQCNFSGPLPSSLGKLVQLTYLHFGMNKFGGAIPSFLQNLTQLTLLSLRSNEMISPIPPWLGNLTKLQFLDLSKNRLHGSIPQSLSNLISLEDICLQKNSLGGTVEFNMFLNMKNLTSVQLNDNNFSLFFGKENKNATSSKFKLVGLSSCNLHEFPEFLRHQSELEWLVLSENNIYGQIPEWMWNTSTHSLVTLVLSNNFLTVFQPQPLVLPWVNLAIIDLSFNMLQGPLVIPTPSITSYDVSGNMLTGEISSAFCNLSSLYFLDLSDNNLSGMIPQCLGNLSSSLSVLNLRNNSLRGIIPPICSNNQSYLSVIDLSYNQLRGKLPRSLSNCMMLEGIVVSNNQLKDVFPSWLGSLANMKLLSLRRNGFFGVIGQPENDLEFPELRVIDLSYNNFSGELPSKYLSSWNAMKASSSSDFRYMSAEFSIMVANEYELMNDYRYTITITSKGVDIHYEAILDMFAFIDMSSNRFEGGIPESIGSLSVLRFLNLSNNMLSGCIPLSLAKLTVLESLDISENNLSGEIPQQFAQLSFIALFNVSHNHLRGPIPQGNQFNAFENSSFEGNPGLCGHPLSKKCGNSASSLPPISAFEEDNSAEFLIKLDWKFVLAGLISGLVVGWVIGDIVITRRRGWLDKMLFNRRRGRRDRRN